MTIYKCKKCGTKYEKNTNDKCSKIECNGDLEQSILDKRKVEFPYPENEKEIKPTDRIEIHHINLCAHGDATVIAVYSGDKCSLTLIDGGEDQNKGSALIKYLTSAFPKAVFDNVILTHYHADHYNGLMNLGGTIKAKELIDPGGYGEIMCDVLYVSFLGIVKEDQFSKGDKEGEEKGTYEKLELSLKKPIETIIRMMVLNNYFFERSSFMEIDKVAEAVFKKIDKGIIENVFTNLKEMFSDFKVILKKRTGKNGNFEVIEIQKNAENFIRELAKDKWTKYYIELMYAVIITYIKEDCWESLKKEIGTAWKNLTAIKPKNLNMSVCYGEDEMDQNVKRKEVDTKLANYLLAIFDAAVKDGLKRSDVIESDFPNDIGKSIILGKVNNVEVKLTLIAGNGYVWDGGSGYRNDLESSAKQNLKRLVGPAQNEADGSDQQISKQNANNGCLAFLLEYNKFRYYTGGDIGGTHFTSIERSSSEESYDNTPGSYVDHETPIAKTIKHVCAMKLNHHGSEKSSNEFFLKKLNPRAIFNSSDKRHEKFPTTAVLNSIHSELVKNNQMTERGFFFTNLYDFKSQQSKKYTEKLWGKESGFDKIITVRDGTTKDETKKNSFKLVIGDNDDERKFSIYEVDSNGSSKVQLSSVYTCNCK